MTSAATPNPFPSCWYVAGATATGKTAVATELAPRIDAEIISLDSMAIFRGMDIGTAKPTANDREKTQHHLLDVVSPTEEYSVSQYRDAALVAVEEIRSRGKQPLFVGGTPLYLKALLRGIFEGPPADWEFRQQIEDELETVGLPALHERLQQVDPLSAAKLHPNDKRRIIRALEVYRATGAPISHLQTQFDEGLPADRCRVFVLQWPREELHRRIEARVETMFADGLIEEVESLLNSYGELGRTAAQAVGYAETIAHLQGEQSLEDAKLAVKARTRQFARRQETWFRGLSECRFLPMSEPFDAAKIAEEISAAGIEM